MTNGYRMTRQVKKYPTLLRLIDHPNIQDWVRDKIDSQRQIAALKSSMVWDVGQSDLEQAIRIARTMPGDPKTISVEHFQSDAIESEKLEAWQKLVALCLNQDNPERARDLVMKFSDPAVRSYLVSNAIEQSNKNSSAAARRLVEFVPDKYAKADLDRELRMRIDKTNLVESIEEQRNKSSSTGQVDVSALVRISRLLRKQDEPDRALELIRPGIDYLKSNPNPMHQRWLVTELLELGQYEEAKNSSAGLVRQPLGVRQSKNQENPLIAGASKLARKGEIEIAMDLCTAIQDDYWRLQALTRVADTIGRKHEQLAQSNYTQALEILSLIHI